MAPEEGLIEIALASSPESEYDRTFVLFIVIPEAIPIDVLFSLTINELGDVMRISGITISMESVPLPPHAFKNKAHKKRYRFFLFLITISFRIIKI
tara:strand:- start:124 stop:411 length:288 start_codon:yes stop_codon:yes gene_type:complete